MTCAPSKDVKPEIETPVQVLRTKFTVKLIVVCQTISRASRPLDTPFYSDCVAFLNTYPQRCSGDGTFCWVLSNVDKSTYWKSLNVTITLEKKKKAFSTMVERRKTTFVGNSSKSYDERGDWG